jgi:hypothetical protein
MWNVRVGWRKCRLFWYCAGSWSNGIKFVCLFPHGPCACSWLLVMCVGILKLAYIVCLMNLPCVFLRRVSVLMFPKESPALSQSSPALLLCPSPIWSQGFVILKYHQLLESMIYFICFFLIHLFVECLG